MTDRFSRYPQDITAPCSNGAAVTPNDSADLPAIPRALIAASDGIIVVDFAGYEDEVGGTDIPIPVVAGIPYALRVQKVKETSTATGIVAI